MKGWTSGLGIGGEKKALPVIFLSAKVTASKSQNPLYVVTPLKNGVQYIQQLLDRGLSRWNRGRSLSRT